MWTLLFLMFGLYSAAAVDSWVISEAMTTVHITPQFVKFVSDMILKRSDPFDQIIFSVYNDDVVDISAVNRKQPLTMTKVPEKDAVWVISLPENTSYADVTVTYSYTSLVKLLYSTVEDNGEQTWVFHGNVNVYSPYHSDSQDTIIQLSGNVTHVGPSRKMIPFETRLETIYFTDNSPVAYVPKAVREISISNWGRIFIRDYISMENKASKQPFSRLLLPNNALVEWTTEIPRKAADIDYRDTLGSIHSYAIKYMKDKTEVKLKARYPLLGGWKTKYRLAYTLPAYEYLQTNGSQFCININVIDIIFENMVVDDFTLKVILPEESQYSGESVPRGFTQMPNEWTHASLDTFGRLVLVFNKKMVLAKTISSLNLCYKNDLNLFARCTLNGVRASFYIFTILLIIISFNRITPNFI